MSLSSSALLVCSLVCRQETEDWSIKFVGGTVRGRHDRKGAWKQNFESGPVASRIMFCKNAGSQGRIPDLAASSAKFETNDCDGGRDRQRGSG